MPTGRRSLWASPITRRILLLNVVALAIPVIGLLYLPTYRDSLIQSELELLTTEGELFSGALAESGVITDPDGSERLQPDTSRQTIRRLVDVSKTRARLFMPNGTLIADSFLLSGPGGILLIEPLPPPEPPEGPVLRALGGAYDWLLGQFPASELYPPYGESAIQVADDTRSRVARRWPAISAPMCAAAPTARWCCRSRCRCSAIGRCWAHCS